jgi:hypothetical protein
MESWCETTSNLLKKMAKWGLFISAAVFVLGFSWLIAAAPCSNAGFYILLSAVALAALSACLLLTRALMVRTMDAFGLAGAVTFWVLVAFSLSSFAALMLCRGV